jgi:hypothetical protein
MIFISPRPHGTRYRREQSLAAVRTLGADQETRQAVVVTVETFVIGQITLALDERGSARAEHRPPGATAADRSQPRAGGPPYPAA